MKDIYCVYQVTRLKHCYKFKKLTQSGSLQLLVLYRNNEAMNGPLYIYIYGYISCKMINVIMESNVLNFVKWQGEHRVLNCHPSGITISLLGHAGYML